MSGYVKAIKAKEEVKDKNNELMSSRIDDERLLEKYKAIGTKIEDLKNIWLNDNDRYNKNKIRTYDNRVYTNICVLNIPEDDLECESSKVISIDSLLVYENKYYLQVYLDNCAYKIVKKNKWQIIFMKIFLKIRYYK